MNPADFGLIMVAALIAVASPGPATLAITSTSMQRGRAHGVSVASGVLTGSLMWSCAAALGLGGIMAAHAGLLEVLRYAAAFYLLWLAYKSARSAVRAGNPVAKPSDARALRGSYLRGLGLHLTNPKAIFFFGALYTVGIPATATTLDVVMVVALIAVQSATVFLGYAVLFSSARAQAVYLRSRRWIEGAVAVLFAGAALRILRGGLT
ncbi:Threonine/homoserine/homoserine lactone efflux protein [Monaibacterium marinum]|uniref:Threonine/homoserine/homoserine lactone efflux protein n=1 Tax=Pontivivens marinum TaxID=1690039 RepID=A0A2C9CMG0_9RHOB|nr:LysE family translocator [Monaibacterium marinum]SOH92494.1 Threonine/homoserine/homoserine lactone efflux protein [Monaibacterium marinum]